MHPEGVSLDRVSVQISGVQTEDDGDDSDPSKLQEWIFGSSEVGWELSQKGATTVRIVGKLAATAPIGEYSMTVFIDVGTEPAESSKAGSTASNTEREQKWGPCRTCYKGSPLGGDSCGGGWSYLDTADTEICGFQDLGCRSRCVKDADARDLDHSPVIVTQSVRLVVLLNPYSSKDPSYISSKDRAEYVEAGKGLIWQGLSDNNEAHLFTYRQNEWATLEVALRSLRRMPVATRGDMVLVARHLTYAIGADVCYGKWGDGTALPALHPTGVTINVERMLMERC